MKCARLAVGYAEDDCRSDLPEKKFGQAFCWARNQAIFLTHILLSLQTFLNLLHSISKVALSGCGHVSYKKMNGYAGEVRHWLVANFTFPAVTWKNIVWSFPMPLWCSKHLPEQSASIHCFEFPAVLPVWLFWGCGKWVSVMCFWIVSIWRWLLVAPGTFILITTGSRCSRHWSLDSLAFECWCDSVDVLLVVMLIKPLFSSFRRTSIFV